MIAENIRKILSTLPSGVQLAAVSKYHPMEELMEAYEAGQRIFAENHVQEMVLKYEHLPKDIEWHFIGHLQTNKVKQIVPFVSLIQGVESLRLCKEIDRQAKKCGRIVPILLEIHLAKEDTKFGLSFQECENLLSDSEFLALGNIRLDGLMAMASNTDDMEQIRAEFRTMHGFFLRIQDRLKESNPGFSILSMGMSGDYLTAVEEGSNLVRVGSSIFGARNYSR